MAHGAGIAVRFSNDLTNESSGISPQLICFCKSDDASKTESKCRGRNEGSEDSEIKLFNALADQDDMWRQHERAQIAFLQKEHGVMLVGLHSEIERMHHAYRELQARLFLGIKDKQQVETDEIMKKLHIAEDEVTRLKMIAEKTASSEQTLTSTLRSLQDQLQRRNEQIRRLSCELHERTGVVAQLSSQLRHFRLKEAMLQAQQRRRASGRSPLRSFPSISSKLHSVTADSPTIADLKTQSVTTSSIFQPKDKPTSSTSLPPIRKDLGNRDELTAPIIRRKTSDGIGKQTSDD